MKRKWLVILAVTLGLTGIGGAATATENGRDLLEQRCSVCHPSARPKAAKKTPEQWEATVTRMIGKGARLTADEKKTLLDYLSNTYKP